MQRSAHPVAGTDKIHPLPIARYLADRAILRPWRIEGEAGTCFDGAIVIPALAESDRLFATLASLAANPPEYLERFLVLVVVNHRQDATAGEKGDNASTLAQLAKLAATATPLRLAWVDAASAGLEMPLKDGGVGLARKIGLDLALQRLCGNGKELLLVCLDADTLVQPDYLPSLVAQFSKSSAGGWVLPFCHQPGSSAAEDTAITLYELYLRCYVLGLKLAGSPYGFHTVGSAMACRGTAYARMGGMNRRKAGEDFYFLQQLHKTAGVEELHGTVVSPSPRPSHRVPFGTGRTVSRFTAGDSEAVTFYQTGTYRILGSWLELAANGVGNSGEALLKDASRLSSELASYLEREHFVATWDRLRQTHRSGESLRKAFHDWFDAFRTMQLIHHLSAATFPRGSAAETIPPLLCWAGLSSANDPASQLALLRNEQLGTSR